MPNTYTKLYAHVVFAVRGRESLISGSWQQELYKYISGIIKEKKQKLYIINGMPDHLHLLISIGPDIPLSDLIQDIKASSSKWINEKDFVKGKFYWQEGFAAFSYGESQLPVLINYIKNQEEHHKKKSFKDEYLKLLQSFKVDFNERYLFEFYE